MTLIDPRTPEEKPEEPKEVISAKLALQRALNLKTFKQMVSRPVRKRTEAIAPVSVNSASMVLSEVADELFSELHAWVLRGTNTQIVYNYVSYPKNWRQHVKMAFYDTLPADIANWAHSNWPIVMTKEEVPFEQNIHVCPHSTFPASSQKHLQFIAENFEAHEQLLQALRSLSDAVNRSGHRYILGKYWKNGQDINDLLAECEKLVEDKLAARGTLDETQA